MFVFFRRHSSISLITFFLAVPHQVKRLKKEHFNVACSTCRFSSKEQLFLTISTLRHVHSDSIRRLCGKLKTIVAFISQLAVSG